MASAQAAEPDSTEALRKGAASSPMTFDLRLDFGNFSSHEPMRPQAAGGLRALVADAPQLVAAHLELGRAMLAQDRLDEAAAAAADAVRVDPKNGAAHQLAAAIDLRRRQFESALAGFTRAVTLQPTLLEGHRGRGEALIQLRQWPAAVVAFDRAIQLSPGNAATHARRGVALERSGRFDLAEASYREALRLDRSNEEAANSLASLLADRAGKAVSARLEEWRRAWQARDVERYLGFYSRELSPAAHPTRAAWEADRRRKLAKPGPIEIDTDVPKIELRGERVLTTFSQRYRSGNYSDDVTKRLEWVKEDGAWKIVREEKI